MEIFSEMNQNEFEQIVFCHDKESGLKAIIAIHDTTLGPALGGARMWNYATEEEALEDVFRLAKGMTYKNAAAGLNLGGGKTVIIGDPKKDKNDELLRAYARFVDRLGGKYITAEDVGTTEEDMNMIRTVTEHVCGVSKEAGSSGDPSPITAIGIHQGMKAAAKEAFGDDSLKDKVVAIQGMGNVAFNLCKHLHEEGAKLVVTDINQERVQLAVDTFNAKAVDPEAIYDVECDIFSPCALGATINENTLSRLKAKVIAGSANNQLASPEAGDLLDEKGMVYAPDYVINSGGVINVADELNGYNEKRALEKVKTIYNSVEKVFEIAKRDQIPTYRAADRMAEERIAAARNSGK